MAIVNRSIIVPHSPKEMFHLVDAVEDYPKFLPWCKSSTVHSRNEDEVHATLELSGAGMHKAFTTRNLLQINKMIEIRLVNGPFKHLEGFWSFEALEEGSKICLDMEFEFAGGFMDMIFEPMFHQVTNTLVDAFAKRAEEVYAK